MGGRFEGWYYKHQTRDGILVLIPGRAADHAFVQVVTEQRAYYITYPLSAYQRGEVLKIGENIFSSAGVRLSICHPELKLSGEIQYGALDAIRGDIMGPFRFFPMECRHGVHSMRHGLSGRVTLNGEVYDFTGGRGYIESDSGRSFPDGYAWVQCNDFADFSVMAAVAKIPFYGLRFWGHLCVVHLNGREYRLATYNGGKILGVAQDSLELKRGKFRLSVQIAAGDGQSLPAPRFGEMKHRIRESLSCWARFRFTEDGKVLFEGESSCASYEYEMLDGGL